jgi:hypothetical protein
LDSDSDQCQGGESIDISMVLKTPLLEYASPISPAVFHRPRVSERCMGNQLSQREKILVTNMVKEEFNDIELHDGGGLNLMVTRDTQSSRKTDFG